MSAAPHDISDVRKAWKEANLAPLWENAKAHRPAPPPDASYLWSWDKIRPLITAAIKVASPEAVERRVLQLVPPIPKCQEEQQTSRTLAANIQILLPGEKARPHRHTMVPAMSTLPSASRRGSIASVRSTLKRCLSGRRTTRVP